MHPTFEKDGEQSTYNDGYRNPLWLREARVDSTGMGNDTTATGACHHCIFRMAKITDLT